MAGRPYSLQHTSGAGVVFLLIESNYIGPR
jgi:hypothetical protein